MNKLLAVFLLATTAAVAFARDAAVTVQDAWARSAGPGQVSSGAYMVLTAREPLTLVGASSPAAGIVEIHQMKMEGEIMKMRAVDTLALQPGQALEFKPAGYHFMLMDLKAPFKPDTRIPLVLEFRDARGKPSTLKLSVPVASAPPVQHKH